MKILLIEDSKTDQKSCINAVNELKKEGKNIVLDISEGVDKSKQLLLEETYHGAIIDMNLGESEGSGNDIVELIHANKSRLPIWIVTGTPDDFDGVDGPFLKVKSKGEIQYTDILNDFLKIYNSGITKVLGGKGIFDDLLLKIFEESIYPQLDTWKDYGELDPRASEEAITSHTINHMLYQLSNVRSNTFPEEFYLYPIKNNSASTGSIIQRNVDNIYFIILNPVCDLAIRDTGNCKAERALLIELQDIKIHIPNYKLPNLNRSKTDYVIKMMRNSHLDSKNLHFLPDTNFFKGGLVNFLKMITVTEQELNEEFKFTDFKVAPQFTKDIVSRFAAYYARQGQPEIYYKV